MLDLRQHTSTDEDLSGPGFVAKTRGDVRHRPDSGVVETALETDGAKSSEAVRDADAEAKCRGPNDATSLLRLR